jgi:PAS domain S-box-containing protein
MSARPTRLFIVEDQRLIAADLENTLTRLGYQVVGNVASGERAVEQAPGASPDLMLMDIRLQGELDGIQAAERLQQLIDVPVVYLTAYADEATIARAKLTSPFGYLVKPFNERELRAAIEIALYKHRTDRQLAQEQLARMAAEEFRLLVESVTDYALFRLTREGKVASWNAGATRMFGYQAGEAIGQPASLFSPVGEPPLVTQAALEAAAQAVRHEEERWLVRRDGARFWANLLTSAVRGEDGRLLGVSVVIRDLTERKRREDAQRFLDRATLVLAGSLEMKQTLQQTCELAVGELADRCSIDLVNEGGELEPQVTSGTGAGAGPLPGEGTPGRLAPATRSAAVSPGAKRVFASGRPELAVGLVGVQGTSPRANDFELPGDSDGSAHSALCVPIHYRSRLQGVLTLLRDRSGAAFSTEDLRLVEELARRAGLALENARLFQDAQAAIRARDDFLQVASHELKTPLTPLQLQLDFLERMVQRSGEHGEQLTERLRSAIRQTSRLARLVEVLLDVTRITAGALVLRVEELDLTEVLDEIVERLGPEAHAAGCELIIEARGPVIGRWDRLRLEQVLSNLVSNAIKYGAGKPVELRLVADEQMVRLSVTDHGIGIQADAIQRIFGRFERAVSPRNYGGLGLGLFIALQLAEAHGGTIVATSSVGAGSTFTVLLPRVAITQPVLPSAPSDDHP